jgi:hypothetical protein
MRAGGRDRRSRVATVRGHHDRVVPREADAGEGLRHRRGAGKHAWRRAGAAQRPHDAEEARVARGQHDGVTGVGDQPVDGRTDVAHRERLRAGRQRHRVEVPLRADDRVAARSAASAACDSGEPS